MADTASSDASKISAQAKQVSEPSGSSVKSPLGERISQWCLNRMSDFSFIVILAIVIGIICGLLAFIFKKMIHALAYLFIPHIATSFNWWIIAVPVAGIILTGIFTRYVIHSDLTHLVGQLLQNLKRKIYKLRHNLVFSAIVGGTITLGMGGSSGAEGPIATTGAAIGSNIGQLLRLDSRKLKILIACGASAGIAGIFSSPIGGLMFSLELLRVWLSTVPVIAVAIASLIAYLTVLICNGFRPDYTFIPTESFEWSTIGAVICLGIFCGIYALYYSSVTNEMDKFFKRITNPWLRNLTGGLIIGLILFCFPSMFSTGYPVLFSLLDGNHEAIATGSALNHIDLGVNALLYVGLGILILKCWAVAATNSSGGVGGDFAPTLFAGGIAGFIFATVANNLFECQLPVELMALYGMSATMSGIVRAPIMSIFIVIEMAAAYKYAFPISICAFISYLTVKGGALTKAAALPLVHHLNWFGK